MSYLILVRHGKSEWNELGLWTGWKDIDLHSEGETDAKNMARHIKDIPVHIAHTSKLKRARRTAEIILSELNLDLELEEYSEMNEKNYGIHTGKNKWQVKEEVGEEEFQKIRRSWNYQTPEGESMKQVYERLIPYYEKEILPKLKEGKNVIIASHGNTLRTLVKYLDNLTEDEVAKFEFGIGEGYVYDIDASGKVSGKEIRNKNPLAGKQ